MDEASSCWDFPTDVFVEILRRLPPNARRRLRLVSRQWRDTIGTRTATDMRMRTKALVVTTSGFTAYVVDLLQSPGRHSLDLWRAMDFSTAQRYRSMSIVGTCNGLVCLCDDTEPGGAITIANPATGEALVVPPLAMPPPASRLGRRSRSRSWHQTYDFAYHPMTGRYTVVHVPCHVDRLWEPGTVHVFTLGEAAWRCVSTGRVDTRCGIGPCRLANVDGTVYWITDDAGRRQIMSLDLKDERVAPVEPLLMVALQPAGCHLTKVRGRLAVVDRDSITAWVLEGGRWRLGYIMETLRLRRQQERRLWGGLALPHFAAGDYILTHKQERNSVLGEKCVLYRHRTESNQTRLHSQGFMAQIGDHEDHGEVVHDFQGCICRMFAYVETEEPLRVYGLDTVTGGGSTGS